MAERIRVEGAVSRQDASHQRTSNQMGQSKTQQPENSQNEGPISGVSHAGGLGMKMSDELNNTTTAVVQEIPLFTDAQDSQRKDGGDQEQQQQQLSQKSNDTSPRLAIPANTSYNNDSARGLQAYSALDEVDDKCSSQTDEDQEEEERAVADFVSAMELHSGNVSNQVSETQNQTESRNDEGSRTSAKDDEDQDSQQFSVDDVSDDDDGVEGDGDAHDDQRNDSQNERDANDEIADSEKKQTGEQENDQLNLQDDSVLQQPTGKNLEHRNDRGGLQTNPQQVPTSQSSATQNQHSTACDSATNRDSQGSNVALQKAQNETLDTTGNARFQGDQKLEQSQQNDSKTIQNCEQPDNSVQKSLSKLQVSARKEPIFDKEDIVKGHLQKFLAHVETRELNRDALAYSQMEKRASKKSLSRVSSSSSSSSPSSSSSESEHVNKDNEDPNAKDEVKADQFDPKELRQSFDGWSLYKKNKIPFAPIRRYQQMVDQDYKKNKVTVCAHLQNIYNSFVLKRGKATYQMNNFFDIEKWANKMEGGAKNDKTSSTQSPTKELRRVNTLAGMLNSSDDQIRERENYLLTKSNSTAHIPDNIRTSRNAKRAYGNFDKDTAAKMFGYRVLFQKKKMEINVPEPEASQAHKPLTRYVSEIMGELSQSYVQMHRFHTKQRILIPLPDESDDEVTIIDQMQSDINTTADQTQKALNQSIKRSSRTGKKDGEVVVLRTKHGDRQSFLKRNKNLFWHCAPIQRQQSASNHSAIASNNAKRSSYAKNNTSTIYGPTSVNQQSQSPGKREVNASPKKAQGWNQSSAQKQNPQTQYTIIAKMNQVRYLAPRQGTQNPPASQIRVQAGGSTTLTSQYNYRRQNSYRKQHQKSIRGDSAKAGRGLRQSMESVYNPAYKLTNLPDRQAHNFILNDGQRDNDNEVANITRLGEQKQNVVKLKDPKHIQGFGSEIVHVNVSCSQTLPEKPANESKQQSAAEEEDESQTFVIQLSEEQTKQLAEGTLKLNGVPIPKDLSNLNYDQIMALLDSVNLPPQKSSESSASHYHKHQQLQSSQLPKKTTTPMNDKSRILDQKLGSEAQRRNKTIQGKDHHQHVPHYLKQKPNTNFKQFNNNNSRFMGHTFTGGVGTSSISQINNGTSDFYR